MGSRGYFNNSLGEWRRQLLKRRRGLEYRLTILQGTEHPAANDQAILIDINRQMIEVVESAQRVAAAIERSENPSLKE